MNKGLLAKIALGIIVVALPLGMIFFSKKGDKNQENQTEQTVGLEAEEDLLTDIENNLKGDEEESSDTLESTDSENSTDESSQTKPSDTNNNNNSSTNDKGEANNSGNNSNSNNQGNVEDSTPAKSSSGSFQGFADSSFVEIKTGDTYNVYKVSDSAKKVLSSKEVGSDIKFTYKNVGGQLHIVSVE